MTWFGFFAAMGAVLAIGWLKQHDRKMGLAENEFWAAVWLICLGGIIGAKGFFVWLGWEHYQTGELKFWPDFGTGFVFFGGLVGALTVGVAFARFRGLSFWRGADYFAVALPMGHAIGRLGCYFTGCCPGLAAHPVQLYESGGLAGVSILCFFLLKKRENGKLVRGSVFCVYGVAYGLLRLMLDPLRADGRSERYLGISHQQGIALALIIGSILCWWVLRFVQRNETRTGYGRHVAVTVND